MKGKPAMAVVMGIKCDNPDCYFVDTTVTYEHYPEYINKPCPLCGQNLLTQNDYDMCKTLMDVVHNFNKEHANGDIDPNEKRCTVAVHLDGHDNVEIDVDEQS